MAKAKGVVDGCRCGMELNRVAPGEWYYRYIFVVVAVVVYSSGRLGLGLGLGLALTHVLEGNGDSWQDLDTSGIYMMGLVME